MNYSDYSFLYWKRRNIYDYFSKGILIQIRDACLLSS